MKPIISQSELEELSYKYQIGTITAAEKLLLDEWYGNHDDSFFYHNQARSTVQQRIWDNVHRAVIEKRTWRLWPKLVAAACIVLIGGMAIYIATRDEVQDQAIFTGILKDVDPGGTKAVLVLSDGKRINLNRSNGGNIAYQSGTEIKKLNKGTLEYTAGKTDQEKVNTGFNSIEIPVGGEYQLILPDGSRVWLNSSSSLRYPVNFAGKKNRTVELTGEAYFEVAKDQAHPFIVSSRTQKITVLGTHFNVNSYEDELETSTALLEGAISLSNGSTIRKLEPGERSVNNGRNIQISKADLNQDIAWKNGYFEFQETDLKTVMRQISRWYGLRVSYSGKMPTKRFTGKIHRNLKLSSALKILSYFEVKFTVSDNNVYINN
jgi:ferric-dicitrate binding protein FerR (iron transport regulator)